MRRYASTLLWPLLVDGEALRLGHEAARQRRYLSQRPGGRGGAFYPAGDGFSQQVLWRTAGQEGSAREPGCEIEGHLHEDEFPPHSSGWTIPRCGLVTSFADYPGSPYGNDRRHPYRGLIGVCCKCLKQIHFAPVFILGREQHISHFPALKYSRKNGTRWL